MSALRNIRERKGFNIPQLASRSGIPGKTLLEYEEGRQSIPLTHAKLLAKALWVQIEDLMPPPSSIMPSTPAVPAQPAARAPQPVTSTVSSTSQQVASVPESPRIVAQSIPAQPPVVARKPQEVAQTDARGPKPEARPVRAPKVVPSITEGQIQELMHLATRLDIAQEQLEERVGKPLADLTRPDATDWVKRLRAIADEIAPGQRVKYGKWSNGNEDREAAYLAKQRDIGATCVFRLFNGEEFRGAISEFTPYTITIKALEQDEEVVLRKLAIAYYRCMAAKESGSNGASDEVHPSNQEQDKHSHARDDHHQPIDRGIDSDRTGEPDSPEKDQMDEDRGM
jgi:transcriptional regulator with XRE-family HTH domain/sRNA-binding regulator protein Hfq